MKKLSEYIKKRRCDRLDEWSMDCLAKDVEKLEQSIPISKLQELIERKQNLCEDTADLQELVDEAKRGD